MSAPSVKIICNKFCVVISNENNRPLHRSLLFFCSFHSFSCSICILSSKDTCSRINEVRTCVSLTLLLTRKRKALLTATFPKPRFLHSHTNSVFLHSHERPAQVIPCEQKKIHFRCVSWRAKSSLCRQPFKSVSKS